MAMVKVVLGERKREQAAPVTSKESTKPYKPYARMRERAKARLKASSE
jgi:hypothetical protein